MVAPSESAPLLVVGGSSTSSSSQLPQQHHHQQQPVAHGTASVWETIINQCKTCMCTGCLALPYAAKTGGMVLHTTGLVAICLWNVYAVQRLCQCLPLLPKHATIPPDDDQSTASCSSNNNHNDVADTTEQQSQQDLPSAVVELQPCHHRVTSNQGNDDNPLAERDQRRYHYGGDVTHILDQPSEEPQSSSSNSWPPLHLLTIPTIVTTTTPPPPGTSTFSKVAWYAFGPAGLWAIDWMMATLFVGVVVAYVDAIRGFLRATPVTSGSQMIDAMVMALVIGSMAAVENLGYLSKASATGLIVLAGSFAVIFGYGMVHYSYHHQYDWVNEDGTSSGTAADSTQMYSSQLNWWPEDGLNSISAWFGCVVFDYGIAPLTYNFQESMADPSKMVPATFVALSGVAVSYVFVGVGLYVLFAGHGVIEGDVLQMLPNTGFLPMVTRLSMVVVVLMTAPLLIFPVGEIVEGKLLHRSPHDASSQTTAAAPPVSYSVRAMVRIGIAFMCVGISVMVPKFVSVLSLVGCGCVALVSFCIPPLLHLRLVLAKTAGPVPVQTLLSSKELALDVVMLIWGVVATVITTAFTFRELVHSHSTE